MLQQQSVQTD